MDIVDAVLILGISSVFLVPIFAGRAFVGRGSDGERLWRGYPPLWLGVFKATTGAACGAWVLFILSVYPGCGASCFFLGLPALAATTPLALVSYLALLLRGREPPHHGTVAGNGE